MADEDVPEWNVDYFAGYMAFIILLRRRLGTNVASFNVPQLIPQESGAQISVLDFVLSNNNKDRVRFRLRRDNLYLIGYLRPGTDRWLEFRSENGAHLIADSEFLDFGCSYANMEKVGYGQPVEDANVGVLSVNLSSAVSDLATERESNKKRAQRLILVVMTICEAARFTPIATAIAGSKTDTITKWMMDAVRNWGTYSAVLWEAEADPGYFRFRESDLHIPVEEAGVVGAVRVSTVSQVVQILALILYNYRHRKARRNDEYESLYFEGRPLVEIFSVRIDNIDNEDPGELYGTITVNDGLTQCVYNRPRSYAEIISPGQNVALTGPPRSIWATRSLDIRLLLTDSDNWISDDDEVVKDVVSWDAFDPSYGSIYDKLTSQKVTGKYGSATVNYAVLRNASTALVTINLEEGKERTVQLYGSVVANYGEWSHVDPDASTSVLFNRPRSDYLQVRKWQDVPLLKSIVAVPLGSSLRITTSLYDYYPISADDKVAIGVVEFLAAMSGHSSKDIYGEYGNRVTVTVTWGEAMAPEGDRGYGLRPRNEL